MSENKCSAGCVNFHGGEIKHTEGCVFYSESFTKYNIDMQEKLTDRYIEAEKFILENMNTPWYLRNKRAREFLKSRSKYGF